MTELEENTKQSNLWAISNATDLINGCLKKGFWGEIKIAIQDGEIVMMSKMETMKTERKR